MKAKATGFLSPCLLRSHLGWFEPRQAALYFILFFSKRKEKLFYSFIEARAMKKRKNWAFVRLIGFGFGLQSNVRKLARKKPEPPCIVCHGTGRVDCYNCSGKGKFLIDFWLLYYYCLFLLISAGRTNKTHLTMLPRGEWPKWCKTCSGGGLIYCSRCLGTGEYRYPMGFHFMKKSDSDSDGIKQHHNWRGQP